MNTQAISAVSMPFSMAFKSSELPNHRNSRASSGDRNPVMDLPIKQRNKIIITYVDTLFTICLGDGELVLYRPRFVTFSRQENNRERLLPFAAVLPARWYFAGRRREGPLSFRNSP